MQETQLIYDPNPNNREAGRPGFFTLPTMYQIGPDHFATHRADFLAYRTTFAAIKIPAMAVLHDLENIFSILHDGTIMDWSGDQDALTLQVSCQYLAELIDPSYEHFFVELVEVDILQFERWPAETASGRSVQTAWRDIFAAELEILSADIRGDVVVLSCHQWRPEGRDGGGNLSLRCRAVQVFDHGKRPLTMEFLASLAKKYWDKFGTR